MYRVWDDPKLINALEKLTVHDHLCLLYSTREEQFAIAAPFIKIGLGRAEKCVYIADENTPSLIAEALNDNGIDVDGAMLSGALTIVTKTDTYLKKGYFDPDSMLDFLNEMTRKAREDGFTALRVTGEMTWALDGDMGSNRLIEYEAKINNLFPFHDILAICQYNLKKFPPETILKVIKTHPIVISGGMVCRNFYFIPPEEMLASAPPLKKVERMIENIRDRELADMALRESEERFRIMADHMPALAWIAGKDARCTFFNRPWLEFTGRSMAQELGEGWTEGVHPEDLDQCIDTYLSAFNAKTNFTIEFRLLRADGEYRWILDTGMPRFSSAGEFLGYIGTCVDITDRKHAEDALLESQSSLQSIVDNSPAIIYVKDPDGRHLLSNRKLEKMAGLEKSIVGLTDHDLWPKEYADRLFENDKRVIETGEPAEFEERVVLNGAKRIFYSTKFPLFDASGKIYAVCGVSTDITRLKETEEELRKAKEKAEDATLLKDKFVSLVAHDLKSPFSSMLGLIKLLSNDKDKNLTAKQKTMLNAVLESGIRMLEMVEDLLNISRLQTGSIKLERKFMDAHTAASSAVGSLSQLANQKGIELINEIEPGYRFFADVHLFGDVIQNLVSNAIKFSYPGDRITLFMPTGRRTTIAVKDTGVGISQEIHQDLFKHEIKTSTEGTAGEKGTGLGLPYSFDIMVAHGGSLRLESEVGVGSVFYAELPMVRPRVLVVDDEPIDRMIIREHLVEVDTDIFEASNGEEALNILADTPVDLIVADLMMPIMNGFALLESVKNNPKYKSIPVIIVTSDSRVDTREKVFRMGADDFVSKPITPSEIIPRVKRFIG